MLIGGIQTLTLLDFPGKVACIVFLAGCNMRCGYCHNPEMVLPEKIKSQTLIPPEKILNFLDSRDGFLEGVVISGGEPTIHSDLPKFIRTLKEKKLLVKLDTNGTNPQMLQELIDENLIDYVAMDIKESKKNYSKLTCLDNCWKDIEQSFQLLQDSTIPFEVRSTFIGNYHTEKSIKEMAKAAQGAQQYTVQNFRPKITLDPKFKQYRSFTNNEIDHITSILKEAGHNTKILA